MPKNVMKLIKPSPHRARNDFDLSHRHVYTANFGELLPVTCIETVPGDFIKLDIADLLRAMPMVTSPFMRAKQHFDVWFVPYRDLWHNFDSFITQREQPVSSALKGNLFCPSIDVYDVLHTIDASNALDIVDRPYKAGALKLYELLGYGRTAVPSTTTSVRVNPFRIAAYNYIWYNEYRNKYYDDGSHLAASLTSIKNIAALFNFDAMDCDTQTHADINYSYGSAWILPAFQMRYRQWKKDLYTGQLPSTQFGAVSTVVSSNLLSNLKICKPDGSAFAGSRVLGVSGQTLAASSPAADGSVPSQWTPGQASLQAGSLKASVDVLSLRKSQALQIWRENALRAGNRVSDNMMAHYGVESDFRDHRPTYLGSVDAPLNIGDIDATAQTGSGTNQALGSIVGKGLSSLSKNVFRFSSKDFGVIMVMFSLLPEAEYNANGVDRMNQLLESEDFFVPEYENLGLEAVTGATFYRPNFGNFVMGYAPRYFGYKTKLDKCFGQLQTNGLLAPWCSPREDVDHILSVGVPTAYPLRNLYVDPSLFDNNFNVHLSVSDQFIVDAYFDVAAVRPMTVTGMPLSD